MKILLIRHSEPVPLDSKSERLFRTGQMVEYFDREGFKTEWFVSSFNHFSRKQREPGTKRIFERTRLEVIKTSGYKKNISLSRAIDHLVFGIKTAYRLIRKNDVDVVITSFPTITSSLLAVAICRLKKIPIYIDYRDKWPEVFYARKTGLAARIFKFFSYFVEKTCGLGFRCSDGMFFPAEAFRDFVCDKYKVNPDRCYISPLGYRKEDYPDEPLIEAANMMDESWEVKFVFAGTIGYMFDFDTVLSYATMEINRKKLFVFCGEGQRYDEYKTKYTQYVNIVFLGWMNKKELDGVFRASDVALAPYLNIDNFEGHVPNKFMEYMSYGLPIITCLDGEARFLVESCGGQYYSQGNEEEFSTAVDRVVIFTEDELRKNKEIALKRFCTMYSSDVVYGDIVKLLEKRLKN